MTDTSNMGPLLKSRRGVSRGTFLTFLMSMILAGAGGAIAWEIYGNDVRSRLEIIHRDTGGAAPPAASAPTNQSAAGINANEIVGLVKDLQASQQRTASDVQTVLQLLTSEQAATKTLSDAVAALQAKVDALQRPAVVPAVKKPAPVAARKPPAAPRPAAVSTEPEQPELEPPPGAPARLIPR
jgi:hypothetical protein